MVATPEDRVSCDEAHVVTLKQFNLYLPNGLVHPYKLVVSIYHSRGV